MAKDVITLFEKTTAEEVRALDKELPSDTHLIEYTEDNVLYVDAVRAYTKTEIFDEYWDKLTAKAAEGAIQTFAIASIVNGIGTIKPKLWKGL